jgi:putative two-component system response regulator
MSKLLRVLLIEDSEDDALLEIRALKNGGYDPEYERVETAEAMRKSLQKKPWDIILCDYALPQFNGIEAIALLKETNIDIPLIIVSGAIGEETAVECMRFGAHDYVMKGRLSRLVPAIERELKEAKSRLQRKQAEKKLQDTLEILRKTLGATVHAMSVAVETRDPYTAGHQRRVADLARAIATEMGLESHQIDGLRMAGVIHDIGKLSIPAEILSKPTRLSEIEFQLIKTHPQSGYNILKDIEFPWPIARIVLEHHERMNGSGYPHGLTGDKLLLESRILAVADVMEAIASHRPYRVGMGVDAALDEIMKNRTILYDAAAVDVCLWLFKEKEYRFE